MNLFSLTGILIKKKKNIIQHSCKINFNTNSNMKGKVLIKVLSLNLLMIYRMKIFKRVSMEIGRQRICWSNGIQNY